MPGRSLSRSLKRLMANRRRYASTRDWLLSFYHRLLLRFPRTPLPLRGRVREVRLRDVASPFYVRMGTTDWYVLEEIFIDRVYEQATAGQPHDMQCVVDLGANTGFSIIWWRQFYPRARIIAVEPAQENLDMCVRHVSDHLSTGEVQLVRACVAGSPRKVSLDRTHKEWAYRMQDDASTDEADLIDAMTLPQILLEAGGVDSIDLLKCDIEGAEAEVFANCVEWIGKVRRLVIEIHHPYSAELFMEDLHRGGARFKLYHSSAGENNSQLLFLEQIS